MAQRSYRGLPEFLKVTQTRNQAFVPLRDGFAPSTIRNGTAPARRRYYPMSSSKESNEPEWKALYRAAVLELDTGALPSRIEAAKAAICARIVELDASQASTEASQLQDALKILNVLVRMNGTKE